MNAINLDDTTLKVTEERSRIMQSEGCPIITPEKSTLKNLPSDLPYNTNINIIYATDKEKPTCIDFTNKIGKKHIKTDKEVITPNEICKMIEDNELDDKKLYKMIDVEIEKIKNEKREKENKKEIKTDYSFGSLPNFVKDNEFNYNNSFLVFPKTSTEKDSSEKFNISVSDFVRENWDISINYNNFNNFPPLLRDKDFTIKDMQCYFLVNNSSSPTYVTLPKASDYPHYWNRKEIVLKNLHNQPIYSKDGNVQQLKTIEISNRILPVESKGKYVTLITNGKYWVIKSIF
jgi:hypothetical protein